MWITQPQAAEILGVHPQTVAKMVARGDLVSRGQAGVLGSLDRDDVVRLRDARMQAAAQRKRKRLAARRLTRIPTSRRPPDDEHEWMRTREAAAFMGVSQPAISREDEGCLVRVTRTAPSLGARGSGTGRELRRLRLAPNLRTCAGCLQRLKSPSVACSMKFQRRRTGRLVGSREHE